MYVPPMSNPPTKSTATATVRESANDVTEHQPITSPGVRWTNDVTETGSLTNGEYTNGFVIRLPITSSPVSYRISNWLPSPTPGAPPLPMAPLLYPPLSPLLYPAMAPLLYPRHSQLSSSRRRAAMRQRARISPTTCNTGQNRAQSPDGTRQPVRNIQTDPSNPSSTPIPNKNPGHHLDSNPHPHRQSDMERGVQRLDVLELQPAAVDPLWPRLAVRVLGQHGTVRGVHGHTARSGRLPERGGARVQTEQLVTLSGERGGGGVSA